VVCRSLIGLESKPFFFGVLFDRGLADIKKMGMVPHPTYDLSQKHNVLSTDDEDTSSNVAIGITDVYPLDGVL